MSDAFRKPAWLLSAALIACLSTACDRDESRPATSDATGDVSALPRPETGNGSVTGFDGTAPMPSPAVADGDAALDPNDANAAGDGPGVAAVGTPVTPAGDIALEGGDIDIQAPAISPPATPPAPAATPGASEPGAADAAAVVRSYYGAINAGQYSRAYSLWGDGGRASGQSGQQFAGGFSDTARVTASTGEPGRVEGAAGSRYVTVPVAVEAIQDDGTIRHYDGTYTLRRAVVDGATPEQRQWRISDADLREVE